MKREFKNLQSFFRSRKLKVTRTRRLIFNEILTSSTIHLDAFEIYNRLKKKKHKVSLATVYRTLNILVKSGLVSQIDFGEDHSHYEPEFDKVAHGHLICLSCGEVREFSNEKIKKTIHKIGGENKFQLEKFSVQVFGFCERCKKR